MFYALEDERGLYISKITTMSGSGFCTHYTADIYEAKTTPNLAVVNRWKNIINNRVIKYETQDRTKKPRYGYHWTYDGYLDGQVGPVVGVKIIKLTLIKTGDV